MVTLQSDGAAGGFGKVRHLRELALGDAGVEIVAAEHIVKIFHSIDIVFALVGADEEPNVVPLADRLGRVERLAGLRIDRGLVKLVEPAAANRVLGFLVVLELEFRTGGPGGAALVGHVIHDAAVAGFGDIVVKLELEPLELLIGEDVASVMRIDAHQDSILYFPAGTNGGGLFEVRSLAGLSRDEIVPAMKVLAVEKQFPAFRLFLGSERVDRPRLLIGSDACRA